MATEVLVRWRTVPSSIPSRKITHMPYQEYCTCSDANTSEVPTSQSWG